jgi:hypothetical protein
MQCIDTARGDMSLSNLPSPITPAVDAVVQLFCATQDLDFLNNQGLNISMNYGLNMMLFNMLQIFPYAGNLPWPPA